MVNDLIFELGCEELPSASVKMLADALANELTARLAKAQLTYKQIKAFATPRRIAVLITDLLSAQPSQNVVKRGPALVAAYDVEGNPTQALLGFAKSCGAELNELNRIQTDKGEWIVFEIQTSGVQTKELIPELMQQALSALPIAKPMRWGQGDTEFARPVQWALMLYGQETIAYSFFGVLSTNQSRGHRFHHPQAITIESPKQYEVQLKEAWVIADFTTRKNEIKKQIEHLAKAQEAAALMPQDLLDEVTSIVEWPCALMGSFDKDFLEVPAEAIIASMQVHQKCFALKDKSDKLLPNFITVANIASKNPKEVVLGNEKVIRARLSDAAFFFNQDKKHPLKHLIPATQQVIFQAKLGSLYDKSLRLKALMRYFSQNLELDEALAERVAELSKCDLMTGMVGEFPELQGLMGYYYALHDGEDKTLASALNEQYMPRFAADNLPNSPLGMALSLADRLDTLVGIFAIGQRPSGVKDPFKLRRHALAIARILIASPRPLNLSTLIELALTHYGKLVAFDKHLVTEIKEFILERLLSHYQNQNIDSDLVLAARARQDEWIYDLDKRIQALKQFITYPEASSLTAASKRVGNLLNQQGLEKLESNIQESLLIESAEKALYEQINKVSECIKPWYLSAEYTPILKELATLKEPMDNFFDTVMVMVEEEHMKKNRLALMTKLKNLLQDVVDISKLQLS